MAAKVVSSLALENRAHPTLAFDVEDDFGAGQQAFVGIEGWLKAMTTAPAGGKSHTGRNIGIVVVVLAVVVVGYLLLTLGTSLGHLTPSTVTVTGSVSTTGVGTHAVSVGFSSDDGQVFNAAVVNGQYSVSLPNDHTYSVQIGWSGFGFSGICNAGSLPVNQGPGSSGLTNNWSCWPES
jgi:hypothetical protein